MVQEHSPDGVRDGGLTAEGFLFLHTRFIQRGRLETTWTVLRKFGYGEDLRLTEDYLYPKYVYIRFPSNFPCNLTLFTILRFDVPHDCSVELSPNGYKFLTDLFEAFDKDQDGALNTEELTDLFSTSPGNPWAAQQFPETTVANDAGAVTLQGWLAQWSMTTLLDHKTTLGYLAYFGYPSPRTSAFQVTRPRKAERRKGKSTRNVFLCYVCGAAGSGKTSLLSEFVGRKFGETYQPTKKMTSVVNSVDIEGSEKYLVVCVICFHLGMVACDSVLIVVCCAPQLQEFGSKYEAETLKSSKKTDLADVIAYVYDSSDTNSFSYISNLRVCSPHSLSTDWHTKPAFLFQI